MIGEWQEVWLVESLKLKDWQYYRRKRVVG